MQTHLAISPTRFEAESRAIYRDLETLFDELTAAQFNWQPEGGRRWSIGQCIDHLARANQIYVSALDAALTRARPRQERTAGVPNMLGRWFIGQLEPPVRTRMKAPGAIQPASTLDPAASRQALDDSMDAIKALLDRAWTVDLNRQRFINPFLHLPLFNVASAFLIVLAHMRRHVAQALAVKARPDFPAA